MNASDALLECGAASLPVNVPAAARHFGVKMIGYSDFISLYDVDADYIYHNISYGGFSLMLEGRHICVINEKLCGKARRKWTSAHELGHILSGHISAEKQSLTQSEELEAERFAAGFLAPLTVLNFCGVSSALEVERLCGISRQAAEIRFKELTRLRRSQEDAFRREMRGSGSTECNGLLDESELRLLLRFLPFITSYLSKRSAHDGYEKYLAQLANQQMAI